MPARPRWLLALPDAIQQLDALDRPLLTRRDLEQLFGVSVRRDRIEVRVTSAHDAVAKLFALAQALTHDYDRFATLIEGGKESD